MFMEAVEAHNARMDHDKKPEAASPEFQAWMKGRFSAERARKQA